MAEKLPRTELVTCCFLVEPDLKKKFEIIIHERGFSTMTQAFVNYMRETVDRGIEIRRENEQRRRTI